MAKDARDRSLDDDVEELIDDENIDDEKIDDEKIDEVEDLDIDEADVDVDGVDDDHEVEAVDEVEDDAAVVAKKSTKKAAPVKESSEPASPMRMAAMALMAVGFIAVAFFGGRAVGGLFSDDGDGAIEEAPVETVPADLVTPIITLTNESATLSGSAVDAGVEPAVKAALEDRFPGAVSGSFAVADGTPGAIRFEGEYLDLTREEMMVAVQTASSPFGHTEFDWQAGSLDLVEASVEMVLDESGAVLTGVLPFPDMATNLTNITQNVLGLPTVNEISIRPTFQITESPLNVSGTVAAGQYEEFIGAIRAIAPGDGFVVTDELETR